MRREFLKYFFVFCNDLNLLFFYFIILAYLIPFFIKLFLLLFSFSRTYDVISLYDDIYVTNLISK